MSFDNDTALGYDLIPHYIYNSQGKTKVWCCSFGMMLGCLREQSSWAPPYSDAHGRIDLLGVQC